MADAAASTTSSTAVAGKKRKAGPKIFYQPMHERNIHNVKLLISTVLPVTYEDSLFKRFLTFPEDFAKLAFFDDIFVGCFVCRPEAEGRLYMMILALLAPYRRRGIGSAMMKELLETVEAPGSKHASEVKEVYLHVHVKNEEAQRFYERFGFVKGDRIANYYRGIEPPDAFLYRKPVNGHKLEDLAPIPTTVGAVASTGGEAPAPST